MENTKNQSTISTPIQGMTQNGVSVTEPSVECDPQALLDALYYVWDAFERCAMPYFLVKDTAKEAIKNHDLKGNSLDLGVRINEWNGGATAILKTFLGEPLTETEEKATYEYKGVPINIYFYTDSSYVIGTDTINYRYEQFRVPNPYDLFEKHYYGQSS